MTTTVEKEVYDVADEKLEEILDKIDERTVVQTVLHDHMADGFMALARERYRDASSVERLGRFVYDGREGMRSKVEIAVETGKDQRSVSLSRGTRDEVSLNDDEDKSSTLRKRRGKQDSAYGQDVDRKEVRHADVCNSFIAVPSSEVREAMRCFRMAVDRAIELANYNEQLKDELAKT